MIMESTLTNIGLCLLEYVNITVIFVFILTLVSLVLLTRRNRMVPPGPPLLPFVGNILSLASKDSLGNLARLRRKYGDVYGLYLGKELTVFLNGYETINDAFLKKGSWFARRPCTASINIINQCPGIVSANDKLWKEQRAFTQQALQKLCFKNASKNIEGTILSEANKLAKTFEDLNKPVVPEHYLAMATVNIISDLILSQNFDYDDTEFLGFLAKFKANSDYLPRLLTILSCFPWLAKLPKDILNIESVTSIITSWSNILKKYIGNRKFQMPGNDIIDLYMKIIEDSKDNDAGSTMTEKQMYITTYDLIVAGSETTALTLNWLLLYILQDPELEARLHSEIDDVLGKEQPSLADRPKMPFTEATIMECLRIAHVAPLGVPHSVPHDFVFEGYLIPKNTSVIANFHSIMMDPEVWKEPEQFRPQRFLTPDESGLSIPKEFVPFSLGPRSCVGETLGRMELFLFLTTLLQKFRLGRSDSAPLVLKGSLGVTYRPEPYALRFIPRE